MTPDPRRGEIWLIDLDPTRGSEIQKTRPAVVVSSDAMRKLPTRLVVPITSYQPKHDARVWAVPLEATNGTGLINKSTIVTEQCRAVTLERFIRPEGNVPPPVMEDLDAALKIVFDLS